jgi:hypothetical protein
VHFTRLVHQQRCESMHSLTDLCVLTIVQICLFNYWDSCTRLKKWYVPSHLLFTWVHENFKSTIFIKTSSWRWAAPRNVNPCLYHISRITLFIHISLWFFFYALLFQLYCIFSNTLFHVANRVSSLFLYDFDAKGDGPWYKRLVSFPLKGNVISRFCCLYLL